jgi:RimJ/RimL family protein N-acetyltransferase
MTHFSLQPLDLEGDKIRLLPLRPEHFEALFAVAADPLLWAQHPNPNRYQRDVFANFFEGAIASQGAFLVVEKETEAVVGCSRFYDYDGVTNSILIGYTFVGRTYWGKAYNRELKCLMLAYIFQYVDTVFFHIGAQNVRSQKAIEKIGAVKVGEIEVAYYGEPEKINFVYEFKSHQISGL